MIHNVYLSDLQSFYGGILKFRLVVAIHGRKKFTQKDRTGWDAGPRIDWLIDWFDEIRLSRCDGVGRMRIQKVSMDHKKWMEESVKNGHQDQNARMDKS